MRFSIAPLVCATLAVLALGSCSRQEAGTAIVDTGQTLALTPAKVMDDYFEAQLQLAPGSGIFVGDFRFNDRYTVVDDNYLKSSRQLVRDTLKTLQDINPATLDEQQRISYDWLKFDLETAIKGEAFPTELLPLNQFYSELNTFAQLGSGSSAQPFASVADYDAFLRKLDGFVQNIDSDIRFMQAGMQKGVVLPKVLAERMLPQISAHIVSDASQSLFYAPVSNMPASFSAADQQRLREQYSRAIRERIVPAYKKIHDFLANDYLPHCSDSAGVVARPDGKAWYEYLIVQNTTITDTNAEEIHQTGLNEVARIHEAMRQIQSELKIKGELPQLFEYMKTAPEMYFKSAAQALQAYQDAKTKISARLPEQFDLIPKNDYEIREVEAFRAASGPSAEYQPGTPDGQRAGVFYVNTHDLRLQPRYGVTTLSMHEAAPGHHFQIALAMELRDLPKYRQFNGNTAYVEGWALYAESLGYEFGFYADPIQRYGTLSDELLRAMRLVVDTGLHAKGWSRKQAMDYLRHNSSLADADVQSEVERYMAIPGQALGYKLGQLKIRALREHAQQELGAHFDLKTFHREVLSVGAVPMPVLEQHIQRWIDALKSKPAA